MWEGTKSSRDFLDGRPFFFLKSSSVLCSPLKRNALYDLLVTLHLIIHSRIDRVDFNFPYVAAIFQSDPSILCIPSGPARTLFDSLWHLLSVVAGFPREMAAVIRVNVDSNNLGARCTYKMDSIPVSRWYIEKCIYKMDSIQVRNPSSSAPSNRFPSGCFLKSKEFIRQKRKRILRNKTSDPFLAWERRRCIPREIPSVASAFFVYAYASRDGVNGLTSEGSFPPLLWNRWYSQCGVHFILDKRKSPLYLQKHPKGKYYKSLPLIL